MSYEIVPFSQSDVEDVREFNRRLARGGVAYRFPEHLKQSSTTLNGDRKKQYYLVRDQEAVRGGYVLNPQHFAIGGKRILIAHIQLPLSEGLVDSKHAMVGVLTIRDALRRQPLLFALGMGGFDERIAKMLKILNFQFVSCPFFFWINRANAFFRNIEVLRRTRIRRLILDAIAVTGAGAAGIAVRRLWRKPRRDVVSATSEIDIVEFGDWCDRVWEQSYSEYSAIAIRDSAALRTLYPDDSRRFIRIRIDRSGAPVGWAVLLKTVMRGDRHFGNMTVGSIVDLLALPGHEAAVVCQATCRLCQDGSDVVISNQLHDGWCRAFTENGYFQGPSNYLFAASPQLALQMDPFKEKARVMHMTRGDGDGPINL